MKPQEEPLGHDIEPEPYDDYECDECGKPISQKVYNYSRKDYGRSLCYDCQKKEHNKEIIDWGNKQHVFNAVMREIKFRAWDGEKMYRSYTIDENGEMCTDGDFINEVEGKKGVIHMQYTGLLDKHGTEIYEGDIIRCSDSLGRGEHITRIEFYKGSFVGFDEFGIREVISEIIACSNKYDREGVEVIGNIYENPEKKEG